jgi:hypothetical protein
MKTTARKTENVLGKDLRVNDVVIRGGYEWVIDRITFEPDFPRYVCTCHWSGNGPDPQFFNNNFDTAQRDDIPWTRVVNPRPRRLVCRTEAPAWYATQAGRGVELRQTGTDALLATIRPPAAWGDAWGWNLVDGGVLVERTAR